MNHITPQQFPWSGLRTDDCPVAETLRMLGGKHGPRILHCLQSGEMHFLELQRTLEGISRKVLKDQLRNFEENGLILRVPKHDARRRVGYSLSKKGCALGPILALLFDWSQDYE